MNKIFKLIMITILGTNIYANDVNLTNETKSTMELFLLKIGITGLINNVQSQKEDINKNSENINILNSDVKYLMQQNIKNKLSIKDDSSSLNNPDAQLALLKAENERLKKYLKTLENEKIKRLENSKRIKDLEKSVNENKKIINSVKKEKKKVIVKKILAKKKKVKKQLRYKVAYIKKTAIHKKPMVESKIVRFVKYGDILDIQNCSYYGWCKIRGKKEYIAKYKIKKLK